MYPRTVTAEIFDEETDTLRVFQAEMEAYDAGSGAGFRRQLEWEITGPVIEIDENGNKLPHPRYDKSIVQALVDAAEKSYNEEEPSFGDCDLPY